MFTLICLRLVNYVKPSDDGGAIMVAADRTLKLTDPQDPVNLLNSIVSSREIVRTTTNAKLAQIGQQMDFLVEVSGFEAKSIV